MAKRKKRNDVAAHKKSDIIVRRVEIEDKYTKTPLVSRRNASMEDLMDDLGSVLEKYGRI